MSTLDAVLARIDKDIDQSVERLFALLRIASMSTDPAYDEQCRAAAEHVAGDLKSIGFETSVRPTQGPPGGGRQVATGSSGPRVLFYGHYDVQPVDPLDLWKTPPFEPRIETLAGRAQDHRRPRRLRRQRPGHDLHRGLPRLQGGHRQAAAADHHHDRGRGGVRLEEPVRLRPRQCRRVQARPRAGLRHRHVGRADAGDHHLAARPRLRGRQDHLRRPRPAFRRVRRRGAEPDPAAGENPRRHVGRQWPRHHSGLLRRREGAAGRHQGGSQSARADAGEIPRADRPEELRPAKRTAC